MALSASIEFVSSSARVTSVKFQKGVLLIRENRTHRSDQGHLGPIKIYEYTKAEKLKYKRLLAEQIKADVHNGAATTTNGF